MYEELRRRIVCTELAPGAPLPLAELAAELGVSTMPVRSALSVLQSEGLVRRFRHRGATVAPVELEDLEVIQAVRAGIEGFAARAGTRALTVADVEQMSKLFERCAEIATTGPLDDYLDTQWRMQDICYEASERPRLLALIHQERRRAERYIRLAVSSRELQQNLPLQKRFVDACRKRDGDAAASAIQAALEWTVETTGAIIEQRQPGAATAGSE